jgi:hypothetical protein
MTTTLRDIYGHQIANKVLSWDVRHGVIVDDRDATCCLVGALNRAAYLSLPEVERTRPKTWMSGRFPYQPEAVAEASQWLKRPLSADEQSVITSAIVSWTVRRPAKTKAFISALLNDDV